MRFFPLLANEIPSECVRSNLQNIKNSEYRIDFLRSIFYELFTEAFLFKDIRRIWSFPDSLYKLVTHYFMKYNTHPRFNCVSTWTDRWIMHHKYHIELYKNMLIKHTEAYDTANTLHLEIPMSVCSKSVDWTILKSAFFKI